MTSNAISRDEREGEDMGAAMAGNVMKMAAMKLEGLAETQSKQEDKTNEVKRNQEVRGQEESS